MSSPDAALRVSGVCQTPFDSGGAKSRVPSAGGVDSAAPSPGGAESQVLCLTLHRRGGGGGSATRRRRGGGTRGEGVSPAPSSLRLFAAPGRNVWTARRLPRLLLLRGRRGGAMGASLASPPLALSSSIAGRPPAGADAQQSASSPPLSPQLPSYPSYEGPSYEQRPRTHRTSNVPIVRC